MTDETAAPMAEPGHEEIATETLQEPRGPHLPDALAGIPWLAWVFIVLALGEIFWLVDSAALGPAPSFDRVVSFVLAAVSSVAVVLLPAALLIRHPEATSRARTLLFGTVLLAAVEGLQILSQVLQPFLESLIPADPELPFIVPPMVVIYGAMVSLVSSFGLAYIAVGLSQARRWEGGRGIPTAFVLLVVGAAALGSGIVAIAQIQPGQTQWSPTLALYLGSTVVLRTLFVVAWTAVAVTAGAGARAGEDPNRGWRLAAVGGWMVVGALAIATASGLILDPRIQDWFTAIQYSITILFAAGHLGLLVAFFVGLPSLDEVEDDADAAADEAADPAGAEAGAEEEAAAPGPAAEDPDVVAGVV